MCDWPPWTRNPRIIDKCQSVLMLTFRIFFESYVEYLEVHDFLQSKVRNELSLHRYTYVKLFLSFFKFALRILAFCLLFFQMVLHSFLNTTTMWCRLRCSLGRDTMHSNGFITWKYQLSWPVSKTILYSFPGQYTSAKLHAIKFKTWHDIIQKMLLKKLKLLS